MSGNFCPTSRSRASGIVSNVTTLIKYYIRCEIPVKLIFHARKITGHAKSRIQVEDAFETLMRRL